jgi:HK97 gp10 family phage protein
MARRGETVTVIGIETLSRVLNKLPKQIGTAARTAVRDETELVVEDMRRTAPRRTGELARSIQAEIKDLEGKAVATARHAIFVEYGTSSTPEQPFAGPAAERSRRRFPKRLRQAVWKALKEMVRR